MVDAKIQTAPVNPRTVLREARQRRLRLIAGNQKSTVKVWAANEVIRELIRHPLGPRFRDTIDQSVEWPNDSFTARLIADGTVRTDGPGSGEPAPVDESLNPREQAEAMKPKPKDTNGKPPAPKSPSQPAA